MMQPTLESLQLFHAEFMTDLQQEPVIRKCPLPNKLLIHQKDYLPLKSLWRFALIS